MENDLNQIELEIRKNVPNAPIKQIYFPKLNKTLLCVYLEGTSQSFRLYDEKHGLNCVASIGYRINSQSCYISSFVTIEELQGSGLGRFVYDMALAHADALGATRSYGHISPTDNIRGISDSENEYMEKSYEALQQIYTKLGNKLEFPLGRDVQFYSTWEQGDRTKNLSREQQELLKECINFNKKRRGLK